MRLIARLTALAAALILVVSCLDDPTGPSTRVGGLALQPRFANVMAAAIVDIRDVRVVLRRPGESRRLVDKVVAFPVTGDTLVLDIEVPIQSATELLELTLAMTNSAGDTVFRAGPIMVTASTDPSRQTPSAPVFTYVGTGADASGVRFVNPPVSIPFGQSVTLVAEAFDEQQAVIKGTPVGFELVRPADSVFAKFAAVGSATLVAGLDSASVDVRAVLPGGQSAAHTIAIIPPAPNVWVNAQGGDWSNGANWSRGTVPLLGDSVLVTLGGTYSVNVDVPVMVSRLEMGAAAGAQTLTVSAGGSLAVVDSALFGSTVDVNLAGGEIGGPGYVGIAGTFAWTGGGLTGTGTTRVAAGGSLAMTGATARTLDERTLVVAGTTVWSDAAPLQAGMGARFINEGTFDWTGAGSVQAGALPLATFENRGSFSRAGVGMVQMGAVMVDTIGSSWRLDAGDMQLLNGARMGGNPYTGGVLEVVKGTLSMPNGTSWSTDGGVVRVSGGVVTVDDGATASFPFLELMSGALTHEGTIEITSDMQWLGGGITSNTLGLGGRTRILPGAALTIDGAAVKTFSGSHVLEVAYDISTDSGGRLVFDGTGDLYAGGGARIVNNASVSMQGSGAMLSNLGPPMAVFENTATGTLEATTGVLTGTRAMNFALDNVGSILVNTGDTLRFGGGSVNRFGGVVSIEVGAVALDAGTYTLTDPWNVQGALGITGSALLDLAAGTAMVNGDLTLRVGGRIRSATDQALLNVIGNATFDGGFSELTAGRLEVSGSFIQSRLNTSFDAAGTHVTSFTGTGAQSITFSNPGTSHFQILEIANTATTDSVVLASNVFVTDSLYVLTGRIAGVSPHRLVVGGNVNLENPAGSNFVRPFVLDVAGLFTNDVGGVQPDTLVLNRATTYAWDGLSVPNGPHLRFNAGIVTFQAATTPGDLIASGSAQIVIPGGPHAVGGNFETRAGGTLQMQPLSELSVDSSATFAGGGTVGMLADGRLTVAGDFVQLAGQNQASFAPSGTHTTVLSGTGPQSISFATPAQSHFRRLQVDSSSTARTVTLQTDVTVTDSLTMIGGAGSTTLAGAGISQRLIVRGALSMLQGISAPQLTVPVVELNSAPSFTTQDEGVFRPNTVVYVGDIPEFPVAPAIQYNHVRLALNSEMNFSVADTIAGDLDIESGVAVFGTPNFLMGGQLRTRDRGLLAMNGEAQLTVQGDAIFSGESTAGRLEAGTLTLGGAFMQLDGSTSAFSAGGTHLTVLAGKDFQTVRFTNPGLGDTTSHFAALEIANISAGGVLLETPVQAAGQLRVNPELQREAPLLVSSERGDSLMVEGVSAVSITFNNVPLRIGPSAPLTLMDGFTFQQMSPDYNQLVITRNGEDYTFNDLTFMGEPPERTYFMVLINADVDLAMRVAANNAQPSELLRPFPFAVQGEQVPSLTWNGAVLVLEPLTP